MNAPELLPVQPAEVPRDRRTYIGGSDIAGILGLQPRGWRTAVEIWQRKTLADAAVEPETPAEKRKVLARGTIVEPLVAKMLAQLHGIDGVLVRNRRVQDLVFPHLAAEVDAEIPFPAVAHLFAERGVFPPSDIDPSIITVNLEIKTVHPFAAGEWGEEGTEDVPIHYAAQVQWGLGVTGRDYAIVAALFGADNLVLYPVIADWETITAMRDKAHEFWTCVETREPPLPQTARDCGLLWPKDTGATVEADERIAAAVTTLRALKAKRKAFEDGEEGVDLLIREAMRDGTILTFEGRELASLKTQATASIDAEKLKAEFPDAYKACRRTGTTRVLRLLKGD